MSFQEEIYYKIEAYLSGELDADEVIAFENHISIDDLLKAEVQKHKVANALIMEQRLLSVKDILQEEKNKDSNSNTSFNKPVGFILLAVAAIGIGTSVWMSNKDDATISSSKDSSINNQIVSQATTPENNTISGNKEGVGKETSQPITAPEENGFYKGQIQQIEEQIGVDEKGVLHVDSAFINKNNASNTAHPQIQTPAVKPSIPANPCLNISIQATVKVMPSCSHEATGNILVNNIQGGTKPYSIILSSSNNESVINGALSKGIYLAVVSDANGCVHTYSNIVVIEKDCPIDYSFNPFVGEKWSIEAYGSAGELEIYNKGGVLYYQTHVQSHNEIEWSGMGIGNQIIPGYYIFVLKYVDGTTQRGSVTIVE